MTKYKEEFFAKTDLTVAYPYGGKHYLLRWWSHSTQWCNLLVRSVDALLPNWRIISKQTHDGEPRELWEIDVVSPPETLITLWKEQKYEQHIDLALYSVAHRLRWYYEEREEKELPFGVSRCSSYKYRYDEEGKESKDPNHYSCANCFEGYVFSLPREELAACCYEWKEFEEKKKRPILGRRAKPLKYRTPEAPAPIQDQDLYVLNPQGGHHQMGTSIDIVDDEVHRWLPNAVIMFFHGKQIPMRNEILEFEKKLDDERKNKRKSEETARKSDEKVHNRIRDEITMNIISLKMPE